MASTVGRAMLWPASCRPPLDGSKVLFSLLPDRAYNTMLRYERYGMLLLWAVVLLGVGDRWMSAAIQWTYELFCRVVGF